MTNYYFQPCNGVAPEGKSEQKLHILFKGRPAMIDFEVFHWYWCNAANVAITPDDWNHISILVESPGEEKEGVFLTKHQIYELWKKAQVSSDPVEQIDEIINLFKK